MDTEENAGDSNFYIA